MKTSSYHLAPLKQTATALAALLAFGMILPLAARADGDADRQQIAAYYESLDQERCVRASKPSSPVRTRQISYNRVRFAR